MKENVNKIRNVGIWFLIATFCISTLWGKSHAFFPMIISVLLIGTAVVYKALHWHEYEKDNKRNLYIALFLCCYIFMYTVLGF